MPNVGKVLSMKITFDPALYKTPTGVLISP